MRPPVLRLHTDEMVVDNFAGGGGASLGIEMALGRSPDIAVNHDPEAVAMHAANHPETKHFCESVWTVDPAKVCGGRKVALAWFSPDCTFHSKARGGKPFRDKNAAKRRRGLAWVVTRWARAVKPRVICLENVEEFQDWGPLDNDGKPDPLMRGFTFRRWLAQLRNCGYEVERRELRACDYGAPTTRKRLFIIARSDGLPIVWPEPTHGPGRAQPHRTAAECIEWSIPCPSIFERKRPLAENTLRRIARGLKRYVIEAPEPFIVPVKTWGGGGNDPRSLDLPMRTITASKRGEHALVTPYLGRIGQANGNGKYVNDCRDPLTTVTTKAEHLLVEPYLVRTAHGERTATGKKRGRGEHDLQLPLPTQCASNDFALAAPTLIQTGWGEREGQAPRCLDLHKPVGTLMAEGVKHALVTAFLAKHYGGHENDGAPFQFAIADIGMRMLVPRELFRAQSFPDSYRIDIQVNGKRLTQEAQVRMCGNSVPPAMAAALVRANLVERVGASTGTDGVMRGLGFRDAERGL